MRTNFLISKPPYTGEFKKKKQYFQPLQFRVKQRSDLSKLSPGIAAPIHHLVSNIRSILQRTGATRDKSDLNCRLHQHSRHKEKGWSWLCKNIKKVYTCCSFLLHRERKKHPPLLVPSYSRLLYNFHTEEQKQADTNQDECQLQPPEEQGYC